MLTQRFPNEALSDKEREELARLSRICKGDILTMTTLAACGHPGGSISSLDIYLVLYKYARVDPKDPDHPDRDRIIISHGHTSPGVYSVLGRLGFFPIEAALSGFRLIGTPFEGHVERNLPGIEWSTGNLGQGLSAGCGFAVASRILKKDYQVFVVMSDGEQAKGQVAEARRFARKYNLSNLTAIIDYNHLQISGRLEEVMPQNIKGNYLSDGWKVLEIDGHDHQAIYQALREAVSDGEPTAIIAETVMGKGISFMENRCQYHGVALKKEEHQKAMVELGIEEETLSRLTQVRKNWSFSIPERALSYPIVIDTGKEVLYQVNERLDNRGAFGRALKSLASANCGVTGKTPIAVVDCDLASSVRTEEFAGFSPSSFFEVGVQEHAAATIAGALSAAGVITFFADFGVFGVDETYNQQRLNDLNHTNLKVICTHCGLDVGEDGKTHQCIDYVGIMANLYHFKLIVPADPNQTDRVIRYVAKEFGNFMVAMGRSKVPVITKEDGTPYYGENYRFEYGKTDWLRQGKDVTIITMGAPMAFYASLASDNLKKEGIGVGVLAVSCPLSLGEQTIKEAASTGRIITYEDHHIQTGLGSVVANILAEKSLCVQFKRLGIKSYGESGTPEALYQKEGLDLQSLQRVVKEIMKK